MTSTLIPWEAANSYCGRANPFDICTSKRINVFIKRILSTIPVLPHLRKFPLYRTFSWFQARKNKEIDWLTAELQGNVKSSKNSKNSQFWHILSKEGWIKSNNSQEIIDLTILFAFFKYSCSKFQNLPKFALERHCRKSWCKKITKTPQLQALPGSTRYLFGKRL